MFTLQINYLHGQFISSLRLAGFLSEEADVLLWYDISYLNQ